MLQIEQDPTPIRTRLYHLILDDIPVGTVHIYMAVILTKFRRNCSVQQKR